MLAVEGLGTRSPAPSLLRLAFALFLLFSAFSAPSFAVIIDSGDGTGNTSAPADDPGWANVGTSDGLTVVYLGKGWVITANHVGVGDVILGGNLHTAVPGSGTQLSNPDGTLADLLVFAITPIPTLPKLKVWSQDKLAPGERVMVGNGRNRGVASDTDDPGIWTSPPAAPVPASEAWYWGSGHSMRWGTNTIEGYWTIGAPATVSFFTLFHDVGDPNHTVHESVAAVGDSGGAVFAKDEKHWELAGIMWAVAGFYGQNPNRSAVRGNATIVADLSFYGGEIKQLTKNAVPVPEPALVLQLGSGAALLAFMRRKRALPA